VTTFVSVGNAKQPFRRLLDAVVTLVNELPQPVVVQQGNSRFSGTGCVVRPFMDMVEFEECIRQAELIISHAGAGSIIHAIRAGKIPVVIPRLVEYAEIVDDHQVEFARALAESGRIVLVQEPNDLMEAVREAMSRQRSAHTSNSVPPMIDMVRKALQLHAAHVKQRSAVQPERKS